VQANGWWIRHGHLKTSKNNAYGLPQISICNMLLRIMERFSFLASNPMAIMLVFSVHFPSPATYHRINDLKTERLLSLHQTHWIKIWKCWDILSFICLFQQIRKMRLSLSGFVIKHQQANQR